MKPLLAALLLLACDPSRERPDASFPRDTGANDAAVNEDAGALDAGSSDAGSSDAGSSDAGSSDAGSSDSDAGTSDSGMTIETCAPSEIFGRFEIMSSEQYGSFFGTYRDGADFFHETTRVLERRSCRLYTGDPDLSCEPACEPSLFCGHSGCIPLPSNLNVGIVRLFGTTPELELAPTTANSYYTMMNHPNLLPAGLTARLEVEGGDSVAPFALEVNGVAPIEAPSSSVVVTEHQDAVFTWTPASNDSDTLIVINLDSDHHGALGKAVCEAKDGDGMLVVPAEIVDGLIEAGRSGIGTYIENATMARVTRAHARTGVGCAELTAVSIDWFFVDTVLAD